MVQVEQVMKNYGSYVRNLFKSFGVPEWEVEGEEQEFYVRWHQTFGRVFDQSRSMTRFISVLVKRQSIDFLRNQAARKVKMCGLSLNGAAEDSKFQGMENCVVAQGHQSVSLRYIGVAECRQRLQQFFDNHKVANASLLVKVFDALLEGRTLRDIAGELGCSLGYVQGLGERVRKVVAGICEKLNEVPLQLCESCKLKYGETDGRKERK